MRGTADSEDDAEEDGEDVGEADGADASRLNKSARVEYENEEEMETFFFEATTQVFKKTAKWTLEPYVTLIEWKALLSGRVDKKWNQPGFDSSAWATVTNGQIGQWSQNGIYFVHHFTLEDGEAYPIVEFGVYYKDGCAVYLNGETVYRRNLPSSLNHNTLASASRV